MQFCCKCAYKCIGYATGSPGSGCSAQDSRQDEIPLGSCGAWHRRRARGAQVHFVDKHASHVRSSGSLRGNVVQLLPDVMSRNAIAQQLVTIKEYTFTLSSTMIADTEVYFTRTPVSTSIPNGRLNVPIVPEIGVVLSSKDPPDRSVVVQYWAQECCEPSRGQP